MKKLIRILFTTSALALLTTGNLNAATQVYDLSADWSDTSNPNGVWSYLLNGSLAASGTRSDDPFDMPPPIWGIDSSHPGWSKSNGSELFDHDWIAGDVYGHTTDTLPGKAIEIRWTSPTAGSIDVTGDVWPTRDIGRFNDWSITLNGNSLASGVVGSEDPYSRSNPLSFSALNLAVNPGDILQFIASPSSGSIPDYIGVNLTITLTENADPPPSLTILRNVDQTVSLSWRGAGALQQTESLTPPNWQPAVSQANPQSISTTDAMKFYRVKAD